MLRAKPAAARPLWTRRNAVANTATAFATTIATAANDLRRLHHRRTTTPPPTTHRRPHHHPWRRRRSWAAIATVVAKAVAVSATALRLALKGLAATGLARNMGRLRLR